MKSTVFISLLLILLLSLSANCQTIIPGGFVSGDWHSTGNPYNINGQITVHSDSTLNIHEGVDVIFQGHYKLIVNGWLLAIGTEQDSILFTASDTSEGWHGIRFLSASDSCRLKYCHIVHGYASGEEEDKDGGGIYCAYTGIIIENCTIEECWADRYGGGIYTDFSNCEIRNCDIFNNVSWANGAGIYCKGNAVTTIEDNHISENRTYYLPTNGGGIYIFGNEIMVKGNVINNNYSDAGGAIYINASSNVQVENNLIFSNFYSTSASAIHCVTPEYWNAYAILNSNTIVDNSGAGVRIDNSNFVVLLKHCIIWGNNNSILGEATATYSCIQGGYGGQGNINNDPRFIAGPFGDYYLEQIAAGQNHDSPCVDAGDPYFFMIEGTTRSDGVQDDGIVDMGYHHPVGEPPLAAKMEEIEIPSSFILYPSFPNPFNPQTTIRYGLPKASLVTLSIYNIQGRLVTTIIDGYRIAGYHDVTFDAAGLTSGIYIYRLSAGDFTATGKMVLMK